MSKDLVVHGATYLQHPSIFSYQSTSEYERYELLGDKVLGLCMTEVLLERYPDSVEGDVSRMVNALVSKKVLAEVTDRLEIEALFEHSLKQVSTSVRASMCEVVIAALYKEKSWQCVRDFILEHWKAWLEDPTHVPVDVKTLLQEYAMRRGYGLPVYGVQGKSGPDHACVFTCSVEINGVGGATGEGPSKRAAEEAAVCSLCHTFHIDL